MKKEIVGCLIIVGVLIVLHFFVGKAVHDGMRNLFNAAEAAQK